VKQAASGLEPIVISGLSALVGIVTEGGSQAENNASQLYSAQFLRELVQLFVLAQVELTNIQKKYYRGILERNFSFLSKGTTSNNVPNLMNTMMELRKCCIHPYLLNGKSQSENSLPGPFLRPMLSS